MAEIKKWDVFYNTNSDSGEIILDQRVELLQNYISVSKQAGRPRVSSFEVIVSATKNYTKVEYSRNYYLLEFDSEGKDGSSARLKMSCKVGADGLLRYNVCISDDLNYHYRIIPQKAKIEKED